MADNDKPAARDAPASLRKLGQSLLVFAIFGLAATLVWLKADEAQTDAAWLLWASLAMLPPLAAAASWFLFSLATLLERLRSQAGPQPRSADRLRWTARLLGPLALLALALPWLVWLGLGRPVTLARLPAIASLSLLWWALLPAWQLGRMSATLAELSASAALTPGPMAQLPPHKLAIFTGPALVFAWLTPLLGLSLSSSPGARLAGVLLLALLLLLFLGVGALAHAFLELQNRFVRSLIARQRDLVALRSGRPDVALKRPDGTGLRTVAGILQILAFLAALPWLLLACVQLFLAVAFGWSGLFGLDGSQFSGLLLNSLCSGAFGLFLLEFSRCSPGLQEFWLRWLQRQDEEVFRADLAQRSSHERPTPRPT